MSRQDESDKPKSSLESSEEELWLKDAAKAPKLDTERLHFLPLPNTLPLGGAVSANADTADLPALEGEKRPLEMPEVPAAARYEVRGEFARGGLGRILRAQDKKLDRVVAIKELLQQSGKTQERFFREALLTAKLEHPSIIPIHDIGSWPDGAPYYSMKFVEGRSLDKIIAEKKTLAGRLGLLPHLLDACEAVAYAHSKRVIHRDLKPHNILIGAFGETIVIDWGLAKELGNGESGMGNGEKAEDKEGQTSGAIPPPSPYREQSRESLTTTGAVLGTPAYMPPEQARGGLVDERADVYSLGAILYHMLSGSAPYAGKSAKDTLWLVAEQPPLPLESKQRELQKDLVGIVAKAMARDPRDRYPSAKELAEDLKKFQTGQLVGAHQYSTTELLRRFVQRHRGAVFVALAAFFLLALLFGRLVEALSLAERREAQAATSALDAKAAQGLAEKARDEAERAQKKTEAERRKAERSLIALLQEQGRQELLSGHPGRAAVFLSKAYSRAQEVGDIPVSLRLLLSAAMRAVETQTLSLEGHTLGLSGAAFSPSGRWIVTSSADKTAKLWDSSTGEPLLSLKGHTEKVTSAQFSPDDARLVTTSADKTAKVWDAKTGKLLFSLEGHTDTVSSASFHPNGAWIATASFDQTAKLWDASDGKLLFSLTGHTDKVNAITFSPDGALLLTASNDQTAIVWESATKKRLLTLAGHTDTVSFAAFHPNGGHLLTTSSDRTAKLWDSTSGKLVLSLEGHTGWVTSAAFEPFGAKVVTASSDRTVRVFSALSGELLLSLEGHSNAVTSAVFSPDGKRILTASQDGTAKVFDLSTRKERTYLVGHDDAILSAKFSTEGLVVTRSQDQVAKVWEASSGKLRASFGEWPSTKAKLFVPDGRYVVTTSSDGYTASLQDVHQKRPSIALRGLSGEIKEVQYGASQGQVALVGSGGSVQLFQASTGQLLWSLQGPEKIYLAEFSPDGKTLFTAGLSEETQTHTLQRWDLATGQLVGSFGAFAGRLFFVRVSPDGARVLASSEEDNVARLFEAASGAELLSLGGHSDWIIAARFSPDGGRIITASADGTAKIFAASSGELLAYLEGHRAPITSVELNAEGSLVVTASQDQTAKIWDADTGKLLLSLEGHQDTVTTASFSPDGSRVVAASLDKKATLWDVYPEQRSPVEIEEIVSKYVPWRLAEGRLLPVSLGSSLVRGQGQATQPAEPTTTPAPAAIKSGEVYSVDGVPVMLGGFTGTGSARLLGKFEEKLQEKLAASGIKLSKTPPIKLKLDGAIKKARVDSAGGNTNLIIELSLTVSNETTIVGLFTRDGSMEVSGAPSAAKIESFQEKLLEALVDAFFADLRKKLPAYK